VEIREKLKAALAKQITPILCVSELGELVVLNNLPAEKIVVAYEPIWAIGTGKTPTVEAISNFHKEIRVRVGKIARVIYGGSVDEKNIEKILAAPSVDGVLVGGAGAKLSFWKKICGF
jgi:triosephosphate isomerase